MGGRRKKLLFEMILGYIHTNLPVNIQVTSINETETNVCSAVYCGGIMTSSGLGC
jgi:hypothetical protein